jgi:putative transposase
MPPRRPGRLPNVSYIGIQRYYLTLCTMDRRTEFEIHDVVEYGKFQLLHFGRKHAFAILAYCFMPDHLHVLAEGTSATSDLQRFISLYKQRTGYWFGERQLGRLWQEGYYDHIPRADERTLSIVKYILENPVRAGLAASFRDYPYSGSEMYSLDELAEAASEAPRGRGLHHRSR